VSFRLLYLIMIRVFGWLVLLGVGRFTDRFHEVVNLAGAEVRTRDGSADT